MTKYKLKDIKPNPFRHVDRYPINREKVEALRESIRSTGYWENVVARARPKGKAEVAYGHHRLAALKEEYGPDYEVDLIVKALTNERMLKIMARENMEEWVTNAAVVQETIRAVVLAYAAGEITLPAVPKKTKKHLIRNAPSFKTRDFDDPRPLGDHPYTAQSVAEFIGWVKPSQAKIYNKGRLVDRAAQDRVPNALTALQYIEEGLLTESDFEGFTTTQASALIATARTGSLSHDIEARKQRDLAQGAKRDVKAAKEREKKAKRESDRRVADAVRAECEVRVEIAERRAREHAKLGRKAAASVMREVGVSLKDGDIGHRQAAEEARKIVGPKEGPSPRIEKFTHKLMNNLSQFLVPKYDKRVKKLDEVVRFVDDLPDNYRESAAITLRGISDRCLYYAGKIAPKAKPMKTAKAAGKEGTKPAGEVVYLPTAKPRKRTRPKGEGAAPGAI